MEGSGKKDLTFHFFTQKQRLTQIFHESILVRKCCFIKKIVGIHDSTAWFIDLKLIIEKIFKVTEASCMANGQKGYSLI